MQEPGKNAPAGLNFHHFGLAVKELQPALDFLGALGYRPDPHLYDPLQKVNLLMCWHDGMPAVEIIFPADVEGPLDGLLKQRPEGIVYHLCYETTDLEGSLKALEARGLDLFEVSAPRPAVLFGGKPVSFYMVNGVGLIEIISNL